MVIVDLQVILLHLADPHNHVYFVVERTSSIMEDKQSAHLTLMATSAFYMES